MLGLLRTVWGTPALSFLARSSLMLSAGAAPRVNGFHNYRPGRGSPRLLGCQW